MVKCGYLKIKYVDWCSKAKKVCFPISPFVYDKCQRTIEFNCDVVCGGSSLLFGYGNSVTGSTGSGVIGGTGNSMMGAVSSFIVGGSSNTIVTGTSNSVILGGSGASLNQSDTTVVDNMWNRGNYQTKGATLVTGTYTVTNQDHIIYANTSGGGVTLNLPTSTSLVGYDGIHFVVKDLGPLFGTGAATNNIVINATSPVRVDGAVLGVDPTVPGATLTLNVNASSVELVYYEAGNYFSIVNSYSPV